MASLQSLAMEVANAIPGCEAQRFALEGNTILSGRVMGWGPSLHRTGMTWACNVPADHSLQGVAIALAAYVEVQHRRIGQAEALGLATDVQPAKDHVSHIVSDRVLLDNSPTLMPDLHRSIGKMIQGTMSGRDLSHTWLAIRIREGTSSDPRPRLQVDHTFDDIVFDGDSVLLTGRQIPDTLGMALAGRRIDEIVAIDAATGVRAATIMRGIAKRTIISAENQGGGLKLHFEGDWVPVG